MPDITLRRTPDRYNRGRAPKPVAATVRPTDDGLTARECIRRRRESSTRPVSPAGVQSTGPEAETSPRGTYGDPRPILVGGDA